MKIEGVSISGAQTGPQKSAPERLEQSRQPSAVSFAEPERDEKKVSPEELLDKIKALTEDGLYSVRFEKSKDLDELVVQVVDKETGDVIRQVPPEELLDLTKRLRDLRGAVIKTEG